MKVFIYIESFPYFSETFIYNQFKEFYTRGIDVKLIYHSDSGQNVSHSVVKLIKDSGRLLRFRKGLQFVFFINLFKFPFKSFLLFRYFSLKKALFYILNLNYLDEIENADILHSHFGRVGNLAASLFDAGIFKNVKLVNSFHGFDLDPSQTNLYKIQYQRLFKKVSLMIVNSEYSKSLLLNIEDAFENKIALLPVGVDYELFLDSGYQERNEDFSIIFIGRLIKLKGAQLFLEIANELIQKGYKFNFRIVGDGEEKETLQQYVSMYGLNECVTFYGALSQEKIKCLLQSSSVFIAPGIKDPLTGRCETQGLVIQEAQASGVPVLVSDVGGMKFGLKDGVTGFVIEEGNIDAFVEKIIFFYKNSDITNRFSEEGKKFIELNFRNDLLVDLLLSKYRSL